MAATYGPVDPKPTGRPSPNQTGREWMLEETRKTLERDRIRKAMENANRANGHPSDYKRGN
jgi:hypothetical protein